MGNRLTYNAFRHEVTKELLLYTLLQGQGGSLLFLWGLGTSLFLLVYSLPVYALIWTGAIVALGVWMLRTYHGNRDIRKVLVQSMIRRRVQTKKLSDPLLQAGVEQGIEIFVEITLKIAEIERAHGKDPNLHTLLADACGLLLFQCESAEQVEEFDRGLRLINANHRLGTKPKQGKLGGSEAASRRRENIAAIREGTTQARALASDIGQQLEALMLKLFQWEKFPGDWVWTAELAWEAEEILSRIQAKVKSQREAARARGIDDLVESAPIADGVAAQLTDLHGPLELKRLRWALQSGFSKVESADGLKALQGLGDEYAQLQQVLARRKPMDPRSVARLPPLAEEMYRQGLNVLEDAFELTRAIHTPDRKRLEAATVELEKEIEALKEDETQAARARIREETLALHQERLEMIKRQQLRVDELLYCAGRCEASLHRARIELAALKADNAEVGVSAVIETLRRTINQTREVQEELTRLGY